MATEKSLDPLPVSVGSLVSRSAETPRQCARMHMYPHTLAHEYMLWLTTWPRCLSETSISRPAIEWALPSLDEEACRPRSSLPADRHACFPAVHQSIGCWWQIAGRLERNSWWAVLCLGKAGGSQAIGGFWVCPESPSSGAV